MCMPSAPPKQAAPPPPPPPPTQNALMIEPASGTSPDAAINRRRRGRESLRIDVQSVPSASGNGLNIPVG
ncbi:hypothetical protein UFOVP347_24 [uncultured Caudovirales phage]|uniref:Uncharacterized protein n=1 Tax=uncultured Caudovirales phage TaxID=2100421 RepID=A0A6J5LZH0_9CAUD|nr:hypothetical protein UFOVP347_24 [uncultured Caudovirales phage]